MTPDLWMLTASAVLCALLFIPYGVAQTLVWGVPVSVGNRDITPPLPAWAERGIRAHRNMAPGRAKALRPVVTSGIEETPRTDRWSLLGHRARCCSAHSRRANESHRRW